MTVIVAKKTRAGIEIAWDSFQGNLYTHDSDNITIPKKIEGPNFVALGTGLCSDLGLLAAYAKHHGIAHADEISICEYLLDFTEWKNKKTGSNSFNANIIVIAEGKLFYSHKGYCLERANYITGGAGGEIAHAAMVLDLSAKEAAELACKVSNLCLEPVTSEVVKC